MKKIQNSYKKSGVNISLANKLVKHISKISKKNVKKRNNYLNKDLIGGFGSLYDLSKSNIKDPVIVSCTDGVGTKIELANKLKEFSASIKTFKGRVGEYMSSLYELGLMPMRLNKIGERKKFNKLLQTSLFGGLSGEIQQSLKEYLLDKDTTLSSQISRAEANLATCRQTREAIERTEKNRVLIESIYQSANEMVSSTVATVDRNYQKSREKVIAARKEVRESAILLKEQDLRNNEINLEISSSVSEVDEIEGLIEKKNTLLNRLEKQISLKSQLSQKNDIIASKIKLIDECSTKLRSLMQDLQLAKNEK